MTGPDRASQLDVPTWRRVVYHLGQLVTLLGLLLFLSVFLTFFTGVGDVMGGMGHLPDDPDRLPDMFGGVVGSVFGSFIRAPLGIVIMWAGFALMAVGRAGVAGSGLTLDPQGERRDEEPFNRARGGMLEDTLDASPTLKGALTGRAGAAREVVKVRCRTCQALNDESDRFCGQCGKPL